MFAITMEQVFVLLFAGGPGLAALVLQAFKYRNEAPEREANLAQTLTTTASTMLDRLQSEIDQLREELRAAEDQIIRLEANLETTKNYTVEAARERERNSILELEVNKLREEIARIRKENQ